MSKPPNVTSQVRCPPDGRYRSPLAAAKECALPVAESAITLRGYQRHVCDEAKGKNTVVLLPTGAGKTLVAAEIIRDKIETETRPGGGRAGKPLVVFFVPKIFLVIQQAEAIRGWVGNAHLAVAEYHGGLKFPEIGSFDVLVKGGAALDYHYPAYLA